MLGLEGIKDTVYLTKPHHSVCEVALHKFTVIGGWLEPKLIDSQVNDASTFYSDCVFWDRYLGTRTKKSEYFKSASSWEL